MNNLTIKKYFGVFALLGILAFMGIYVTAQETTNTDLDVNAGVQTIYAGDATDNDDVCSLSDITNGTTVEGIVCSTAANSL
ncbi:hypothetical protein HC864_05775, partial [Candidatus Gracilibacteria bacterium]|nr:hypothetical protein [Candidatus Gracilibacteria bacterium]